MQIGAIEINCTSGSNPWGQNTEPSAGTGMVPSGTHALRVEFYDTENDAVVILNTNRNSMLTRAQMNELVEAWNAAEARRLAELVGTAR